MEKFSSCVYGLEWSIKTLNEPIKIAKNLHSQVTVFSFVPKYCFLENWLNSAIGEEIFRAKFKESLSETQQIFDEKGVREETLIFACISVDVIVENAKINGVDLLLIVSKSRDVKEKTLFRSVTQKVAANLGCLVLTSNN